MQVWYLAHRFSDSSYARMRSNVNSSVCQSGVIAHRYEVAIINPLALSDGIEVFGTERVWMCRDLALIRVSDAVVFDVEHRDLAWLLDTSKGCRKEYRYARILKKRLGTVDFRGAVSWLT